MPNFYLNSFAFEARFNSSLFFNDMSRLKRIIDNMKVEFPQNNFDSNLKVLMLNNPTLHFDANIRENNLGISWNEPSSVESFKTIVEKTFNEVVQALEIDSFNRVGMRMLRGIEKKSLKEAVTSIRKNFIKPDDKVIRDLSDNIDNYAVTFLFGLKEYKAMLNIKPNMFKILEIENNEVKRNIDIAEVLVDSDVYKEGNVTYEQLANRFIQDVIDINNKNIDNFIRKASIY